ncbi:DUF3530 family protein [Methylomonas sp. AM2-LC]|uniref:DUF3530 family protein n=1 Tax=Methylomonas sp. AM2-LC TaxID=3153301 RepID=UPI003267FA93
MKKKTRYESFCIGFILLLAMQVCPVFASDNKREQDYAALLERQLLLGKIVWLEAAGQRFLGLYTEAEKTDNSNAVIILHEMGAYPDQKSVAFELRTQLPRHNWASLALQMPLRETSATEEDYYSLFPEAEARVASAVEYLHNQGAKNIVLVGYGLGALMATYSVSKKPSVFAALITISLPVPSSTVSEVQTEAFIKTISLPFLDLYAEFDLPTVLDTVRLRRMAGKDNPMFWQQQLDNENHTYQQDHERLVKRVYSWLGTTFQNK